LASVSADRVRLRLGFQPRTFQTIKYPYSLMRLHPTFRIRGV